MDLIIGCDGFIGRALVSRLPGAAITSRRRDYLDGPWAFDLLEPDTPLPRADTVYLCAGINGTLICARDPQTSFRVNVDGTICLAERLAGEAFLVWISSTTAEWCQDHYGQQKRLAETVLRQMPHVGIVRAGRVTPQNVGDLCDTMVEIGRTKRRGVIRWGADEQPYAK